MKERLQGGAVGVARRVPFCIEERVGRQTLDGADRQVVSHQAALNILLRHLIRVPMRREHAGDLNGGDGARHRVPDQLRQAPPGLGELL